MQQHRANPRARAIALAASSLLACAAQAQVIQLPPTTVTATRFREPAQALPFGVSVVTAAEIERSGATTVNEALMRVLGVPGRQDFYGGGEYNLDLRGFGATADNNQLVILDGVRLSEADLGGTRLSAIPIESVERIEVLRGSGAVLYGEGATGGVIVITTKSGAGRDRANAASVYAGAGSHRLRDLRANANVGAGGFSLDVSGQKREGDNHRDNFRSELGAASATAQWAGDGLRVGARHARDDLDARLPGALSAAQYAANPRQSTTPDDWASLRNQRSGVFGEATWQDWQFALDVGRRTKELRSLNQGFPFDYDIAAQDASLRAQHEGRIAGVGNRLQLGIDRARWTRDTLGDFGSTARQSSHALYARDDLTLAGGTRLSAGWRTERIEKENTVAPAGISDRLNAWELGASTPIARGATVYGRVGRSFRLPNVDEFSFTSPSAVLRPQTSRDVELGARWSQPGTSVDARVFRNRLQDEIGFDPNAPGPFGFAGANVNFDPTQRQGLELDASHALTSTLGLRLNASARKASFRAGSYVGRDVPLVPRHTLALRADWQPAEGHRLSGGVQWVSSQHPDYANACSIPAYAVADARYAYSWRNAEFSLAVANLADRKFFTQAFGCVAGTTSAIYPEAGRSFTAALRLKF